MKSITQISKDISKVIRKRHRTHYLKWRLDNHNDWSIRYFFVFDDREQYVKKWVLKSHIDKIYIILSIGEAKRYIQKYSKYDEPEEIYGVSNKGTYQKFEIHPTKGVSTYAE